MPKPTTASRLKNAWVEYANVRVKGCASLWDETSAGSALPSESTSPHKTASASTRKASQLRSIVRSREAMRPWANGASAIRDQAITCAITPDQAACRVSGRSEISGPREKAAIDADITKNP